MRVEVVEAAAAALREKKGRPAPAVCRRADLRTWVLCGKSFEKAVSLRPGVGAMLAWLTLEDTQK